MKTLVLIVAALVTCLPVVISAKSGSLLSVSTGTGEAGGAARNGHRQVRTNRSSMTSLATKNREHLGPRSFQHGKRIPIGGFQRTAVLGIS